MTNQREYIFSLPEGTVLLQCPVPLSRESLKVLTDLLRIIKRNIGRETTRTVSHEAN
jgi:hypothetical protein